MTKTLSIECRKQHHTTDDVEKRANQQRASERVKNAVKAILPFIAYNNYKGSSLFNDSIYSLHECEEIITPQSIVDCIRAELNDMFDNDIPAPISKKLDIVIKMLNVVTKIVKKPCDIGVVERCDLKERMLAINSEYSLKDVFLSRISKDPSLKNKYLLRMEKEIVEAILNPDIEGDSFMMMLQLWISILKKKAPREQDIANRVKKIREIVKNVVTNEKKEVFSVKEKLETFISFAMHYKGGTLFDLDTEKCRLAIRDSRFKDSKNVRDSLACLISYSLEETILSYISNVSSLDLSHLEVIEEGIVAAMISHDVSAIDFMIMLRIWHAILKKSPVSKKSTIDRAKDMEIAYRKATSNGIARLPSFEDKLGALMIFATYCENRILFALDIEELAEEIYTEMRKENIRCRHLGLSGSTELRNILLRLLEDPQVN